MHGEGVGGFLATKEGRKGMSRGRGGNDGAGGRGERQSRKGSNSTDIGNGNGRRTPILGCQGAADAASLSHRACGLLRHGRVGPSTRR